MTEEGTPGMTREMEMGLAQMEQIKAAVESMNMQRESLVAVIMDYNKAADVLKAMEDGTSDEVMLPIGGLVHVKASIDTKALPIVDQGMGVMIEMEPGPAMKRVIERRTSVEVSIKAIEERISDLMGRYEEISGKTQQMYQSQMGSGEGPEKTF
ncbi:MAG: prefoldin subunit alpha [Candidatus Thermoplasmatota archaeon]|nr:prefoldin subunit alpha [Candidatus Thermoplasmatota archaeon]